MNPLTNLIENIKSKDGQSIEIPYDGNLPLLALGDIGILLWREKRRQILAKYQMKQEESGKK